MKIKVCLWIVSTAFCFCVMRPMSLLAEELEKVTFLFPAPPTLIAFSPHALAQAKGYFRAEGLEVAFKTGQGGADVATQVGAGNAEIGGGIGDTPVIVRPNGVPVKAVAVLGGGSLTQIYIREDAGLKGPQELKGKTIAVTSYQDTTFYAFLGVLSRLELKKSDVDAQAVGPGGVVQLVVGGQAQALSGVPEWAAAIEAAGVKLQHYSVGDYFPAMAQAIIASDDAIAKRPKAVGGVVRAVVRAVNDVITDPDAAIDDYIQAMPQYKDKRDFVVKVLKDYRAKVYLGQKKLGAMDEERLTKLQDFYLKSGIIRRATPVAELYTNKFIP